MSKKETCRFCGRKPKVGYTPLLWTLTVILFLIFTTFIDLSITTEKQLNQIIELLEKEKGIPTWFYNDNYILEDCDEL